MTSFSGLRMRLAIGAAILAALPAFAIALQAASAASAPVSQPTLDPHETMQGGAATSIEDPDADAFSHFSANLPEADVARFRAGNALFRKVWTSDAEKGGLGPLYNASSCIACHIRDGRGHPPDGADDTTSMIFKLARPADSQQERAALTAHLALNIADPVYGRQLQDKAIAGLTPEGRISVRYHDVIVAYPDGDTVTLRRPVYTLANLSYGSLDARTKLSPRMAPPMIGLGLIEAIADADLVAHADPDDRNRDGVSGRPQWLGSAPGGMRIGRFGWKAERAGVRDQSAHALLDDFGLSTPDLPFAQGDCTQAQTRCLALVGKASPRAEAAEADASALDLLAFYSQNLAVPARRKASFPETLAGKTLFYQAGCAACHAPSYRTRTDWPQLQLRGQLIWPYSDFLLHDMGEDLADGQSIGIATGREWRTPPLWGLGLTETVGGKAHFLHDGRARSMEEAILWHGGEAERARAAFARMERKDRDSLIGFLNSL